MTKKKGFKRALSLICVLCLTLAVLGSNVFAAADDLDDENAITAQAETIDDSEAIQETQSDDAAAAEDAAGAWLVFPISASTLATIFSTLSCVYCIGYTPLLLIGCTKHLS